MSSVVGHPVGFLDPASVCYSAQEGRAGSGASSSMGDGAKRKGVGEKVSALEKEIETIEIMMELEVKELAEVQVERDQNRRQRDYLVTYYKKRKKEIDDAGKVLKAKEGQLERKKGKSTAKLVAQKGHLRKVLEEAAAKVGGSTSVSRLVSRGAENLKNVGYFLVNFI